MPRRQRTLRGRVSWVGLIVIGVWLLALTLAFNAVLAGRLAADLNQRLRIRADDVAATVAVDPTGGLRVSEPASDGALDSGIWIFAGSRVVDRPQSSAAVQRAARRVAAGPGGFATVGADLRLYARPIVRSGRRVGTVVTALPIGPSHRYRDEVLIASIVLALLALAGAYAALRWAVARALRPVDRMTRQAAEWSAARLGERFGADQQFRELQVLAATFDSALDRQAAAVRHERHLLAELSHELRTPLSRILAETDLMLARPHSLEETRLAHDRVRATAKAMDRIIGTLLSTARAETLAAAGSCRLADAVAALLEHRHPPGTPDGRPAVRLDVGDETVGVESAVVERILAPMVDNAARYATSQISVTSNRANEWVLVHVSDDGPGVDPGHADEIFAPGTQFGLVRSAGGAGLGLALARRLARAAGGDVTFVGGSRFEVRLPPG